MSAKDGFIWDESYIIGNEQVDAQHHQLFDLVNSLVNSRDESNNYKKLKSALDFLVNYAVRHFDDEETLQIECNFPGYEDHKKMHDDFKVTVVDLVKRFEETGSSSKLKNDIQTIVVKWLVNHILYEDKKIGVHLQSL